MVSRANTATGEAAISSAKVWDTALQNGQARAVATADPNNTQPVNTSPRSRANHRGCSANQDIGSPGMNVRHALLSSVCRQGAWNRMWQPDGQGAALNTRETSVR